MPTSIDPHRLQFLVSRIALLSAVSFVLVFVIFILGGVFTESVSLERAELMGAASSPVAYRLAATFDILVWLGLGAILVSLAALIAPVAPVRALLVTAIAAGQVVGMLGGVLRLTAVSELGARFAAGGDQAAVEAAYLAVSSIVFSAFTAGALLWKIGFLLVGLAGFSLAGFPRWAAGWLVAVGVLGLALDLLDIIGIETAEVGELYFLVGLLGLFVVLAVAFWRPRAVSPSVSDDAAI